MADHIIQFTEVSNKNGVTRTNVQTYGVAEMHEVFSKRERLLLAEGKTLERTDRVSKLYIVDLGAFYKAHVEFSQVVVV
jgi:hypothetical protein